MVCPGVPVILNIHYPEQLFPGMFPGAPDLGVPVPWSACFLKCIFSEASAHRWPAQWSSICRHTCFYACPLLPTLLPRLPVLSNVCSLEQSLKGMLPEVFVPWCACSAEWQFPGSFCSLYCLISGMQRLFPRVALPSINYLFSSKWLFPKFLSQGGCSQGCLFWSGCSVEFLSPIAPVP
jgi:hypothetical protein